MVHVSDADSWNFTHHTGKSPSIREISVSASPLDKLTFTDYLHWCTAVLFYDFKRYRVSQHYTKILSDVLINEGWLFPFLSHVSFTNNKTLSHPELQINKHWQQICLSVLFQYCLFPYINVSQTRCELLNAILIGLTHVDETTLANICIALYFHLFKILSQLTFSSKKPK